MHSVREPHTGNLSSLGSRDASLMPVPGTGSRRLLNPVGRLDHGLQQLPHRAHALF